MIYDALIVGGGAAGLFCAGEAAARGKRVLLLESNARVGEKILISGGGRCNFTNLHARAESFISENPDFARSALARFTPADFTARIEAAGIAYYEKTLGQLFCEGAGAARKVVAMLLARCAEGGVDIRTRCAARAVTRAETFRVETDQGAFAARTLVIASGGLSIPKIGASDFAYRIAAQFGLRIVATRPGLVPLVFGAEDLAWMRPLAGASAPVEARADGPGFREAALFTHRGLSGPAILQASSYWRPGGALTLDWAPDAAEDFLIRAKRARPAALPRTALAASLPDRLAAALARDAPERKLGDWKDADLAALARALKNFSLTPSGTEGYAKSEVTVGGIDTAALSQKTMEARAAPGLFFIGEALDVTGWLGGYNFQWAWASAHAAAAAL